VPDEVDLVRAGARPHVVDERGEVACGRGDVAGAEVGQLEDEDLLVVLAHPLGQRLVEERRAEGSVHDDHGVGLVGGRRAAGPEEHGEECADDSGE
jgi:hypothetical protein